MLLLNGRTALATALLCAAVSLEGQAAIRSVNCDAGDTIQGALPDIKSGDTLLVSGTCTGTVTIPPEMVNVTLDGKGAANIRGPNGFVVLGREITIRGFDVTAVGNGISVFRGGTAVIDGNTIHDTGGGLGLAGRGLGINVAQHSFAAIVSNRIRNNPGTGINVIEASAIRIGFVDNLVTNLPPNVIDGNGYGIQVNRAVATIVGATIAGNQMDGIRVRSGSHADIANNAISGNQGNGITVFDNASVSLTSGAAGTEPNTTDADSPNQGFGLSCTVGGSVSQALGTLKGVKGPVEFDRFCVDSVTR